MTNSGNGEGEVYDARDAFRLRNIRAKQRPSNTGSYAPVFHVPRHVETDGVIPEHLNDKMIRTLGDVAAISDSLLAEYSADPDNEQSADDPDTL